MNNSNCLPSLKESLFGLSEHSPNNIRLAAKLNYTLLFMRFYINFILVNFTTKLLLSRTLPTKYFANQIEIKYQLEKFRNY